MIKLIIFDLDGTLVDSRETHYHALNMALKPEYKITPEEHYSTYDGLSTTQKLNMLTKLKNLPISEHSSIWKLKQKYTEELVSKYEKDERICNILKTLKENGFIIYIASNCTWKNLILISQRKGFLEHVDWVISNEDVKNPKPSPEMFLTAMIRAKVAPFETLILEDSPIGKKAVIQSGAHLLSINSPSELSLFKILNTIDKMSEQKINIKTTKKCNVVIPMAGNGSRFKNTYTFPKPLIEVKGKPMIELVVNNLNLDCETAHFIFIVQKEHYDTYDLKNLLSKIAPNCEIIITNGVTEGALCSVLLAENLINSSCPLVIANSDQFVEWNSSEFFYQMENVDCGIATFNSSHPKWSYVKLDENGFVNEVAEKKVISNIATVGIYYFAKGSDFVKFSRQMIDKNIRVNGEFYVCPVFNEFVQNGKKNSYI